MSCFVRSMYVYIYHIRIVESAVIKNDANKINSLKSIRSIIFLDTVEILFNDETTQVVGSKSHVSLYRSYRSSFYVLSNIFLFSRHGETDRSIDLKSNTMESPYRYRRLFCQIKRDTHLGAAPVFHLDFLSIVLDIRLRVRFHGKDDINRWVMFAPYIYIYIYIGAIIFA